MRFDRKTFFNAYRAEFGALNQLQVDGLNKLLTFIENDPHVKTVEVGAFLLATPKHETDDTYHPIHEYGSKAYFVRRYGGQTKKGKELGNDTADEGYYYAGKGYPQTTGESNYEKAEDAIRREYPQIVADFERRTGKRFDLTVGDDPNDTTDPQNMLDPAIAYATMSYGARTGMFTGKKLSDYNLTTAYGRKGSRRIINGLDKADRIATYIEKFIRILEKSLISSTVKPSDASDQSPGTNGRTTTSPSIDSAAVSPERTVSATSDEHLGGDSTGNSPSSSQEQPPLTQTADTIVNAGNVSAEPTQDIHQPAVVTTNVYQGTGLIGVLKRDFIAIGGGNISFQSLQEYATQASGWPPWVVSLITKLATIAIIAGIGWLGFRLVHYLIWRIGEWRRERLTATINADPKKKNLEWVGTGGIKTDVRSK